MSRHKSRVTRRGRHSRKARTGTRKQSGGLFDWLKGFMGKKPAASTPGAEANTAAAANPATVANPAATPGAVAPATPGAVAPNAAAKPWWNPFGGGGRKKSRKTSHRRHHHHRK